MKTPHTSTFRDLGDAPLAMPPGPAFRWGGLPWLRALSDDFLGFSQKMHRQYGDIVHTRVLNERAFILYSPELIRAVLVDNAEHLIRAERPIEVFAQVQGQSVMVSEGEQWERQHRMLRPGFTPKRVAGYAALMTDAAARSLDEVGPRKRGETGLVDITALMSRMPMDVIMRTLFSSAAGDETTEMIRAVKSLDEIVMKEFFWPMTLPDWLPLPGKALKRWGLRAIDGIIARHIADRRAMDPAMAPKGDLLAMLMAVRDNGPDGTPGTGPGLEAQELHDQCKVMFLAGYETTATALIWWTWLMASHPGAAAQAREEVDAVVGGRNPCPDDLPKLPWLTATLKEAMRLYPPAPGLVTRRTRADIEVGGWTLPKRSLIVIMQWVAHRDPRWFAKPEAFMPERFMPGAPAIARGAWMPFGAGPRVCIGQHFAMLEMTLIAAMLLQRHALATDPHEPDPQPEVQVTLRPARAVKLRFTRR